jgi:hypothetical protein
VEWKAAFASAGLVAPELPKRKCGFSKVPLDDVIGVCEDISSVLMEV